MNEALSEALAGQAAVVFAEDLGAVARLRAAAATSDMVLLVLAAAVSDLDRAMLIAALGPLAIELAPRVRIAALDLAANADVRDVTAAASFLANARSTTGQVVRITARG